MAKWELLYSKTNLVLADFAADKYIGADASESGTPSAVLAFDVRGYKQLMLAYSSTGGGFGGGTTPGFSLGIASYASADASNLDPLGTSYASGVNGAGTVLSGEGLPYAAGLSGGNLALSNTYVISPIIHAFVRILRGGVSGTPTSLVGSGRMFLYGRS